MTDHPTSKTMMPAVQTNEGEFRAQLTGKEALRMRARLASEGKAICERCRRVGPARDSLTIIYKGNVLTSMCPACLPAQAVLVQKDDARGLIQVRLVDPDRSIFGAIALPTPQERTVIEGGLGAFGPKTEKREL